MLYSYNLCILTRCPSDEGINYCSEMTLWQSSVWLTPRVTSYTVQVNQHQPLGETVPRLAWRGAMGSSYCICMLCTETDTHRSVTAAGSWQDWHRQCAAPWHLYLLLRLCWALVHVQRNSWVRLPVIGSAFTVLTRLGGMTGIFCHRMKQELGHCAMWFICHLNYMLEQTAVAPWQEMWKWSLPYWFYSAWVVAAEVEGAGMRKNSVSWQIWCQIFP